MTFYNFTASVDAFDRNGNPLIYEGEPLNFEDTRYMAKDKDAFQAIQGDGAARVSVGLSVKLSGPNYSSASIQINVTLTCGQRADLVQQAEELALEESSRFLDANIPIIEGVLQSRSTYV